MLDLLVNSLFSLVYPQFCQVCSGIVDTYNEGPACAECWQQTRIFTPTETRCPKCGSLSTGRTGQASANCGECTDHFYDHAFAVGVYEKALAATVLRSKAKPEVPKKLSGLISDAIRTRSFAQSTLIVPVPLSRKRALERGFNQALLIARMAAKELGAEVDEFSLIRTLHTPKHRAAMDRKARESTVRNAFEVKRPKLIAGRHILLTDDIFTSGGTASNCAEVLKEAGAASVTVFTVARAVKMFS